MSESDSSSFPSSFWESGGGGRDEVDGFGASSSSLPSDSGESISGAFLLEDAAGTLDFLDFLTAVIVASGCDSVKICSQL